MSNKSCKFQKSYFSMVFPDDNTSDTEQMSKLDLDHTDSSNKPSNKSCKNNEPNFSCYYCDYISCRKSSYEKHLATQKHLSNKKVALQLFVAKQGSDKHICHLCDKEYKSRAGLWSHKKSCKGFSENEEIVPFTKKEEDNSLLLEILKQNEEFKQIMVEQNRQILEQNKKLMEIGCVSTTNINSNNTMNNKFNLQIFLNETCKDAMNIQEFIDFCKVEHSDFENFGKFGYVEALTRIFLRNLLALEVHKRPIHCSDIKREVLYVKDNDVWESDVSRSKLIRTIKYIANKNVKQIPGWMDKNPDSKNTQTKLHDKYMRMLCFSMGAKTEEEDLEYYKKIIRNVAKEVCIDKWK